MHVAQELGGSGVVAAKQEEFRAPTLAVACVGPPNSGVTVVSEALGAAAGVVSLPAECADVGAFSRT